jgi:hypothetical protein
MSIKYTKYFFIILAACLFYCTETDDGCLDSSASNFDVTADKDCCQVEEECCCTYPNLSLVLFYKQRAADTLSASNTNFKLETFYAIENSADSISIDTFELFISQVKPINLNVTDSICVLESIEYSALNTEGETEVFSIEDNVVLIDAFLFSFDIGTYSSDLDVEQVALTLGLSNEMAQINPDNIITNNNLGSTYNFLFNENLGLFPSMKVKFTIKSGDQQRIISRELAFRERLSFTLSNPIINENGSDMSLPLRINVLDVFKGIIFDVANEDIDLIVSNNLVSSVSLIEQ